MFTRSGVAHASLSSPQPRASPAWGFLLISGHYTSLPRSRTNALQGILLLLCVIGKGVITAGSLPPQSIFARSASTPPFELAMLA